MSGAERGTSYLPRLKRLLTTGNGSLLIPLAALVACIPLLRHGISCGHDFDFHLVSWMETRRAWSQGVLHPHWAQSPNWAAGEPRFIFYPPLTWLAGAALSFLTSWEYAPVTFIFLLLTAVGFTTRALARELLPGPNATLAGVIATSAPYAYFTAYERAAYSELASAASIPLLILFTLRLRNPETATDLPIASRLFPRPFAILGLAGTLTATWLTNAPAGVMASYLIAFLTVVVASMQEAKKEFWKPVLRAALAAAIGLGLAAFYLVPAAWEQRWIAIEQAVDVGMRITDSWLFARHASPDLQLHDQVLLTGSLIVIFTFVAAAIAFGICLRRQTLKRGSRVLWMPLMLLLPVILLLQLPISASVWTHLPKLEFLQFPWRWLVVMSVPYSIFLAAATPLASRRSRMWSSFGWAVALVVLAVIATHFFYQQCDDEDNIHSQAAIFDAGTGVEGTDEYAPKGSDNSIVASGLPNACLVEDPLVTLGDTPDGSAAGSVTPVWFSEQGSCDDTFSADVWQNEYKRLEVETDHGGYLVLRLRRYPAWQVTINGKLMALPADGKLPVRDDGLMVIPVDGGPTSVEVRWTTTRDVIWGRWISLDALLFAVAFASWLWLARQRSTRNASETDGPAQET